MSEGVINAVNKIVESPNERQTVEIALNFGVFFDGTNNNAVQSMIALNKRRRQFFNNYKKEIKSKFPGHTDLTGITRQELEQARIGTPDDLDNVYGYANKIDLTLEKSIASANSDDYNYSSAAVKYDGSHGRITKILIDDPRREKLSRAAGNSKNKFVIFNTLASKSTSAGSGYTNVALLCGHYVKTDPKTAATDNPTEFYHSIYIEGSGANEEISVIKQLIKMTDSVIGLGFGVDETGVIQKCRKAISQVKSIYQKYAVKNDVVKINCHFDVFGFSRGATTSRCFTYVLNPKKADNYVDLTLNNTITGSNSAFLGRDTIKLGTKNVRVLGLFDTVSSIGVLREGTGYIIGEKGLQTSKKADFVSAKSIYHDTNVDDFGLHSTDQADAVLHLCALDEFRKNFALVDICNSINTNGIEVYIPGCHTDVGGGSKPGLDDLKIINCDEIATRGEILYNFYVRINSIVDLYVGLQGLAKDIGVMTMISSSGTGIPFAYNQAKSIIPDMHHTVLGLFSLVTGFESLNSYRIVNKGGSESTQEDVDDGFNVITDFLHSSQSVVVNVQSAINSSGKVVKELKSYGRGDIIKDVRTSVDLYQNGISIIKAIKNCRTTITHIIDDFIKFKNDPKILAEDVKRMVLKEINSWRAQSILIDEMIEALEYIFTGEHNTLIIPIEQRRICMYTGIPYDDGFRSNRSKVKLVKPLSINTLREMGWLSDSDLPETEVTFVTGRPTPERIARARAMGQSIVIEGTKVAHFFRRNNIAIQKYTYPGYTLIALKTMHKWAISKGCKFNNFAAGSYDIPYDLNTFYSQVSKTVCNSHGKFICVPDSMSDYKYFRWKYLHMSINQQILSPADNGVVNGPSFLATDSLITENERDNLLQKKLIANKEKSYLIDNVITRRIYPGTMCHPSATGGREFVDKPNVTLWYLNNLS